MIRRLIGRDSSADRLLDIGCGCPPLFLLSMPCADRHGLEKEWAPEAVSALAADRVMAVAHDLASPAPLPFPDDHFTIVTMMAVLEHFEPGQAPRILAEIRRVLAPGGLCLLTTPAAWTASVLAALARVHLVSPVEIADHKSAHTAAGLRALLREAQFRPEQTQVGHFQLGANLWARAVK